MWPWSRPGPSAVPPWEGRPSLYSFIAGHIDPHTGELRAEGLTLPDDERISQGGVRWAPGAMDGTLSHHWSPSNRPEDAERVLRLLEDAAATPPDTAARIALYNDLLAGHVLSYLDALIPLIPKSTRLSPVGLLDLARWLALEAPDREPVKLGVALMGMLRGPSHRDLFTTLGTHDEFTLYALVALRNTEEHPEPILWELARRVHGWGRIHLVERLVDTQDPALQEWLLREGYKNTVLVEYLAAPCARAGRLRGALAKDAIDEGLLDAAAEIIEALIHGEPGEGIDGYEDAAPAINDFCRHLSERASTLRHYLAAQAVHRFVTSETPAWADREADGWTPELRAQVAQRCESILRQERWKAMVLSLQTTTDEILFYQVKTAADALGIDLRARFWARVQEKPEEMGRWFDVMRGATDETIDGILAYASAALPLAKIASGPGRELGLGAGFAWHSALDAIVQDLKRFPGRGEPLLLAALRSAVVRNRNAALSVLDAWPRERVSSEIRRALATAVAIEPEEKVRDLIKKVQSSLA